MSICADVLSGEKPSSHHPGEVFWVGGGKIPASSQESFSSSCLAGDLNEFPAAEARRRKCFQFFLCFLLFHSFSQGIKFVIRLIEIDYMWSKRITRRQSLMMPCWQLRDVVFAAKNFTSVFENNDLLLKNGEEEEEGVDVDPRQWFPLLSLFVFPQN
jgi:hypothetical protein